MKFLVDAQLPRRLAGWLCTQGFDVISSARFIELSRNELTIHE
uniref:DUF5615 domain-containing protein n=1 Tax=Candidatus Kentrum sp. DK TaxID=2126562 RepID=A0A450T8Y3_9GAMM|nr:MAG: hypothetical protein BECKDK2373C_GA0170839_11046 [Candidatus Kentron sp. DK]